MKSGKVSKMATVLAVLFLVVSGLMVVQWNAQPVEATEHDAQTYTIEGFLDTDVSVQSDLTIKLRDLSSGKVIEKQTSEDYYQFPDVKAGWYEIIFPTQVKEDNAYLKNMTDPFKVSGQDKILDINLNTRHLNKTLQGDIKDTDGELIENATVTVENKNIGFRSSHMVKNKSHYKVMVYQGFEGTLKVKKEGYAPFVNSSVSLADYGRTQFNVNLSSRPLIEGHLVDESGSGITETLDITLYNQELGVMHSMKMGPTFSYRVAPGYDYTLVVKAPGYKPLVKDISALNEGEYEQFGRQSVSDSGMEEFHADVEFKGIENLTVNASRTLRTGTKMKTMDYSYIGNLAMQVDLALGDGDLDLESDEIDAFKNRLKYSEADIPSTYQYITTDDTAYELSSYDIQFSNMDKLGGDVKSLFDGKIMVDTERRYTSMNDAMDTEAEKYLVDFTVEHDEMFGNMRDFTYTMDLPEGYERYIGSGTDQSIPENVTVENYTQLEIDPMENGMSSKLTLDVRESEKGQADIIVNDETWIHEKKDDHFVIRKGTEAKLECDYTNPTSQAIDFEWSFGGNVIGEEQDITHTFDVTGTMDLTVEVEESNGLTISDEITVTVDDEGPQGDHIKVDKKKIGLHNMTSVDEDTEVDFSAIDFEDVGTGLVKRYSWNFSDGSSIQEGMNLTHTFNDPGEYVVKLNLTDGVGNWNRENITVKVEDTTKPTGDFKMQWGENETYQPHISIVKGTEVTFNATEMKAHPEYEGELEYEWEIKDIGETGTGPKMSYTFSETGEYSVHLNVTDSSGNYRKIAKNVTVQRGPTPDLMVSDLTFSKSDLQSGKKVTVSVNVTNVGDAIAEDVTTTLKVDGNIVDISEKFYKNGEELNRTTVKKGETLKIKMKWTPDSDGKKKVSVNVTDGKEPGDLVFDNEKQKQVNVSPPAWREYLVYALIPIVIIGVVLGLYFYRDRLSQLLG